MKKIWKRLFTAGMALAMVLGLAACGSGMNEKDAAYFIQGNMDAFYLDKYDAKYLEFMDITENEAEEQYQGGLDDETDFFISYFYLDEDAYGEPMEVPDEIYNQIREIYKGVYAKSNYTVGTATKLDEGGFGVPVKVQPIDVIKNMEESYSDYMSQFLPHYTDAELEAMSESDLQAYYQKAEEFYNTQYQQKMVDLFKEKADNLGFLEEKSLLMEVKSKEEGKVTTWYINHDNQSQFDEYLIYYPAYSNYTA